MNYRTLKRSIILSLFLVGSFFLITTACAKEPDYTVKYLGDNKSIIELSVEHNLILLPVEDRAGDAKITVISDNKAQQELFVRLAQTQVDYQVPLDLSSLKNKNVQLLIEHVSDQALCWSNIKIADAFDTTNREAHRPHFHFSPSYGWMNDPNGMVYKDGEYHLFFQHNPYGSTWQNMHWGHAISKDLYHWEEQPVVLAPDIWGSIFSGSAVVDHHNVAGFGEGAIIAFYTSAGIRQTQGIAYSTDNGRTFTKYENNPILTSDIPDFRDPKVFWHAESNKWILIIAAGQEMQLFSSNNLKEWTYESAFGKGEGCHEGVWECPDLVYLPVEGTNEHKWVLICNINPGGPYGGSATQYFVGDFDGHQFINDAVGVTKWMDWGKDHYATVTWSDAPDNRTIAIAWMSNWEYANVVPTNQFRSANSIPRDLFLFQEKNGQTYLQSKPSQELGIIRGETSSIPNFEVDKDYHIESLFNQNEGCYELDFVLSNQDADVIGFRLFNNLGEEVNCFIDLIKSEFTMDRTKSGLTEFSDKFARATTAPLLGSKKDIHLKLVIDKASVEIFGNDGKFVMTNIIYPNEPYNRLSFYGLGGNYQVKSFTLNKLAL